MKVYTKRDDSGDGDGDGDGGDGKVKVSGSNEKEKMNERPTDKYQTGERTKIKMGQPVVNLVNALQL